MNTVPRHGCRTGLAAGWIRELRCYPKLPRPYTEKPPSPSGTRVAGGPNWARTTPRPRTLSVTEHLAAGPLQRIPGRVPRDNRTKYGRHRVVSFEGPLVSKVERELTHERAVATRGSPAPRSGSQSAGALRRSCLRKRPASQGCVDGRTDCHEGSTASARPPLSRGGQRGPSVRGT